MTCKCDAMYIFLKKSCSLWYKKLSLKMLTCFDMIWNCDNFSRWNTKSSKICRLPKILIYSKLIIKKHMMYWDNYKYNK
jgi:hypothetical protein